MLPKLPAIATAHVAWAGAARRRRRLEAALGQSERLGSHRGAHPASVRRRQLEQLAGARDREHPMHPGIGIVNFVLRQQPQLTEHVGARAAPAPWRA